MCITTPAIDFLPFQPLNAPTISLDFAFSEGTCCFSASLRHNVRASGVTFARHLGMGETDGDTLFTLITRIIPKCYIFSRATTSIIEFCVKEIETLKSDDCMPWSYVLLSSYPHLPCFLHGQYVKDMVDHLVCTHSTRHLHTRNLPPRALFQPCYLASHSSIGISPAVYLYILLNQG